MRILIVEDELKIAQFIGQLVIGMRHAADNLHHLSSQGFYQDLNQAKEDEFYFFSMGPNIINGKVEIPLRPIIRVSKRIRGILKT
jgi:hypothetical protein